MPYFHYIVLQNFYTYSVTIKQCKTGQNPKNESSWVTILKDYQLMRNAHFETDAQNWHILGTELVSIFGLIAVYSLTASLRGGPLST